MKLIIALFLLSTSSFAQYFKQDKRELLQTTSPSSIKVDDINTYPEIFLKDDSILTHRENKSGVINEPYFTGVDHHRLSASFQFSYDYEDITKIQTLEALYLNRFDQSFTNAWWGLQFKRVVAQYNAIADERTTDSGDANSTANLDRTTNIQSISMIGVGLAYRFKAFADLLNSDRTFEVIQVFGDYCFHLDSTDDEKYAGYGYNASYSLEYRSSNSFFYGAKLSYNWVFVERSQVEEEKLPDRTLVFGWTQFGVELGYYF